MDSTPGAGPSQAGMAAGQTPAGPQWRQFNFFDVEGVKDIEDLAQAPAAIRVSVTEPNAHRQHLLTSLSEPISSDCGHNYVAAVALTSFGPGLVWEPYLSA